MAFAGQHKHQEINVYTYFDLETDAAYRRREWERTVAAKLLTAQIPPGKERAGGPHVPSWILERLRAFAAAFCPMPWWPPSSERANHGASLEGRHATVT